MTDCGHAMEWVAVLAAEQRARDDWAKGARLFKLDPAWLDRDYTRPTGERVTIVGLEASRSRFPVLVRRADGLVQRVTTGEVRRHVQPDGTP